MDEARPYNVSRPFFRYAKLNKSTAHDFPIQADPGAAGASTEGTGLSNTALSTDKATATAGTIGQMATVTDELSAISIMDAWSHFGAVLARSVAEKYETDFVALIDDFANTTSTTGVDLTVSKFLEAKAAVIGRDAVGTLVAILHTTQTGDLQQDMATSTAAQYGNPSINIGARQANELSGYAFELAGVPIYHTSLVNSANAGADRHGAIFVAGVALGLAETWGPRTELQRDASMPGTEVVVTARYGVVEIRDTWGQGIVSDL